MKDRWSQLSMSEKSDLMSLYIRNGISSLEEIKKHYNSFATDSHLYQDGGPDNDKYSFLRREPEVAVADNTRVTLLTNPIELAQARAEYDAQQRQAAMIRAAQNQPQLRADTRTDSDRRHEVQRREKQARLDATRAAQRDFVSLGRPNTESQQAAVMAMPYTTEAASNYLRNDNVIRDLGYFAPGISNVLMAQDTRQQINNGYYGWAVLSGLGALSPVLGLTPNFKSPARYTKPANQVGDWTILDYGRTESPRVTTQYQLSSRPTLQLTPTRSVEVVPNTTLQLGMTSRQAITGRPMPLRLPEETASSRALYEDAMQQHIEDLDFWSQYDDTPYPYPKNAVEEESFKRAKYVGNIKPQIKPLISGAEIEKQLSKTGTISRKSLNAYIAKQGKYYQRVMQDVLQSDFNGIDKINYKDFQNTVQERLPSYTRVPQTEYDTYGATNIGMPVTRGYTHAITGKYIKGDPIPVYNTFTFEAPGFKGYQKHYRGTPLGHSRTYTTPDEPEVLHVMESQSDWAQSKTNSKKLEVESKIKELNERISVMESFRALYPWTEDDKLDYQALTSQRDKLLKSLVEDSKSLEENHMMDTYTERQIQENLKYALENGQSKMRYPTRETVAKIEGYPYRTILYDQQGNRVISAETRGPELDAELENLIQRKSILESEANLQEIGFIPHDNTEYYNIIDRIAEITDIPARRKAEVVSKREYDPNHETILKKYDAFPKQFQKLFGKKAEVRTVTDSKGNTWYEVDVPESYRNGTGQIIFSLGGLLGAGALTDK